MSRVKNFMKVTKTFKDWHWYFLDFWLKKKGTYTYHARNGGLYTIRQGTDDRYIVNEICVHDVYNPANFGIHPGDIVLDIGAQVGIFSTYAGTRGAKVFSFEPMPDNYLLLNKQIERNHLKNVTPINKAVSDKVGKSSFFVCEGGEYTGRHSLFNPGVASKNISVKTTTLKEIMEINKLQRINFLKLDCEGAEYDILFKCPKNILESIGKISMEFHDLDAKRNHQVLAAFLQKQGYKVTFHPRFDTMLYAIRIEQKE